MERWRKTLFVLMILSILGCAETGLPPGGPEDKTGPKVVVSQPPDGAVNQSNVRSVQMEFSERVMVPTQGASVYISPRPASPPKISWGARSLTIVFADSLTGNCTYVISIPGLLTDLRGNRPDTSISLAFATGPALDSGRIAGEVFAGDKGAAGVAVALFDIDRFASAASIDSIFPDYLTLTGGKGEFQFTNLPAGRFRLVAYQKSGRDDRFRPIRQKFALPDRDIEVGGAISIARLTMSLTSQDTTPVKISSAAASLDGVLQMRLSSPVSRHQIESSAPALVVSMGGGDFHAVAISPSDSDLVTTVQAYCGRLPQGVASIKWLFDSSRPALTFDSLKVPAVRDTTKPVILAVFPSQEPLLTTDTAIHIRFSEPIDTSLLGDSTIALKTVRDSTIISASRTMPNLFDLVLRADSLKTGGAYTLTIQEKGIRDLVGNALGDSLRTYGFSIFPADSLGWIDGAAHVSLKADSSAGVGLTFRRIIDGRRFLWYGKSGSFQIALPGGKYVITGYVDRNANRRFDAGAVFPFTLAETQLKYTDTVAVRARFETAGVDLEFK
jgi:hypothetical protein